MGLITTFDSGKLTGWAQGIRGRLTNAGLVHVHDNQPMRGLPVCEGGIVYVETPVHRRTGETVNPNDLIKLGLRAGRIVETYLVMGNDVRTIPPTTWKGGTPKEIQNRRDEAALTPDERSHVQSIMRALPEGQRNNVWDAIGIFIWAAVHVTRDRK